MAEETEATLVERVDQAPGVDRATEADEEQVLAALYGVPDQYGIYRGTEI
ncbi:hypothetical protein [Spirillospora sp. NBC_01491]|nr:hypothetical protein [Spirillospora sp. NBC_01491]